MTVYLVYVYEDYWRNHPGECVGCSQTRDGAREIVRSYRRHVGMSYSDIVTERKP